MAQPRHQKGKLLAIMSKKIKLLFLVPMMTTIAETLGHLIFNVWSSVCYYFLLNDFLVSLIL